MYNLVGLESSGVREPAVSTCSQTAEGSHGSQQLGFVKRGQTVRVRGTGKQEMEGTCLSHKGREKGIAPEITLLVQHFHILKVKLI